MFTMLFRTFLIIVLCTTVLTDAKKQDHSNRKKPKHADARLAQSRFSGGKRARFQLDDECGRPQNITDSDKFDPENLSPLDVCCDKRNACKDYIGGYQYSQKYHLHNEDATTRVSCKCEKQFYNCLHAVNTPRANYVGWMYYSQYTNAKCFLYDYPSLGCEKWVKDDNSNPRCKQYEVDRNKPLQYEWRDLPFFEDDFPHYPEYTEPVSTPSEPSTEQQWPDYMYTEDYRSAEYDQYEYYGFKDGYEPYKRAAPKKARKSKTLQHKSTQANRSNKPKNSKRKHARKL